MMQSLTESQTYSSSENYLIDIWTNTNLNFQHVEEVWGLFLPVWGLCLVLFSFCFVSSWDFFTKCRTPLKIRQGSLEEMLPLVNLSAMFQM